MVDHPVTGQECSICFLQARTLYTVMSNKRMPVLFPANVRFDGCIFQEAFYDPYTAQHKYAIQVPLAGKVWTVHIRQDDILFIDIILSI